MSLLLVGGLVLAGGYIFSQICGDSSSRSTPPSAPAPRPNTPPSHPQNQKQNRMKTVCSPAAPSPHAAAPSSAPQAGGWFAQCGTGDRAASGSVTLYDPSGNPLQLGEKEEFASGGEGTVYRCPQNPRLLIKVYQKRILDNPVKREALERRLRDMIGIQEIKQNDAFAWPLMLVYDKDRRIAGFVMRSVRGTSLMALQGQQQIARFFPTWNRKDLALVAEDFLEKVRLLVRHGILVNDFNPRNFIVGKDHRVRFIDCDSFQIPASKGGAPHIATSYFGSHAAPELLLHPEMLNTPRGEEQARFSAAIVVFQLLMCGLHPYNHRNGGTPENNLKSGKCPLGQGSGAMLPVGWYNLVSYLPYTLMNVFVRMFRDGHGNPSARPKLSELLGEVRKFLFVMNKDPVRCELNPSAPKPKSKTGPDFSEKDVA